MTNLARQREADRVELVYHWALVQIGAATLEDALSMWEDVPASQKAATSARWLSEAIQMVMLYRGFTRELALAYYRLVRALRTGTTIADPRKPEPQYVSMEMLRREFEALVNEVDPHPNAQKPAQDAQNKGQDSPAGDERGIESPQDDEPSEPVRDDENAAPIEQPEYDPDDYDDEDDEADKILVEEIADLDALIEQQDRKAEEEAAFLLDQLGTENLLKKLEEIDEEQSAQEVDAARAEAHRQAGARAASVAERITLNAARGLVYSLGEYDGRVLAWARFSQTGTPCHWCAMLISRGAIYKSKRSAQHQGKNQDEDKYHDNCHCVAIPCFTEAQYGSSDLFALNRQYEELWQKGDPMHGLPAHPTIQQWRSYFRRMRKREARALEAAQPQT